MACFSPKNAQKISTPFQMKYLANRFSKIVTNIEPIEGLDPIISEIETYSSDDDVAAIQTKNVDEFWREVSALKEGDDDSWAKYPLLPRFAFAMSTIFNSNSEAERGFSVQTAVHRNPKRNMMLQETFEAHMQVHYGVECQQSKELCSTCSKHQAAKTRQPHQSLFCRRD